MLLDYAAKTFGFRPHVAPLPQPARLPLPEPGTVTVLLGPSGAGKTRALRAMAARHQAAWVGETASSSAEKGSGSGGSMPVPDPFSVPVLDLFKNVREEAAMRILAACGLADGRLWSLRVSQLSAGEQQRLWLARALAEMGSGCREMGSGSGGSMPVPDPFSPEPLSLLIADEFDAHLDFDTAHAIGQNLRRLAARENLRVIVSTHRPEVLPWLAPARVLHLEGGLQDLPPPAARDLADEITFEQGRLRDWDAFAQWHYLGHGRPGPTAAVWLAKLAGRAVGIAVFGFPHLLLAARKGALPRTCEPHEVLQRGAAFLNANVRLLSRIVIDPRLRGCGVANALLRHALPRVGVPFIECIAQMGEFTGFLQRAGFEHAGKIQPPRAVMRVRRLLEKHAVSVRELMAAPGAHPHMQAALRALVKSRIESGHGHGREGHANDEAVLQSALARLYAEPAYLVWRGQQTHGGLAPAAAGVLKCAHGNAAGNDDCDGFSDRRHFRARHVH